MSVDTLAGALAARPPARVAVDGPDAAGKTTFANALATALRARGRAVARVQADDFLNPPEVRYARGHLSPHGYYEDAFDLAALRAAVLANDAVVADGVFLLRPELDDCWDVRVFVDVDPDEQMRRALERDVAVFGDEATVRERYALRYRPAYESYALACRPRERADVVVAAFP